MNFWGRAFKRLYIGWYLDIQTLNIILKIWIGIFPPKHILKSEVGGPVSWEGDLHDIFVNGWCNENDPVNLKPPYG